MDGIARAWNKEIHGALCLEVGVWLMQSHFRIVGGGGGRREEKKCLQGAGRQRGCAASHPHQPLIHLCSAARPACAQRSFSLLRGSRRFFFSGFFLSFKRALCTGCSVLGSSPTVWGEKARWFGHNAESHCQSQLASAGHPFLFLLNKAFLFSRQILFFQTQSLS